MSTSLLSSLSDNYNNLIVVVHFSLHDIQKYCFLLYRVVNFALNQLEMRFLLDIRVVNGDGIRACFVLNSFTACDLTPTTNRRFSTFP